MQIKWNFCRCRLAKINTDQGRRLGCFLRNTGPDISLKADYGELLIAYITNQRQRMNQCRCGVCSQLALNLIHQSKKTIIIHPYKASILECKHVAKEIRWQNSSPLKEANKCREGVYTMKHEHSLWGQLSGPTRVRHTSRGVSFILLLFLIPTRGWHVKPDMLGGVLNIKT